MVKIISDFGFCFGVDEAIKILKKASASSPLFLTHPLIHNIYENEVLMKECKASIYNGEKEGTIVLSAHGHTLEEEAYFLNKGFKVVDATCPLIKKRLEFLKNKNNILYFGKKDHQETKGFLSNFPTSILIDQNDDYQKVVSDLDKNKSYFLVPQTTISEDKFSTLKNILKTYNISYDSLDICPLYKKRIKEAITFLENTDPHNSIILVIGDKLSSNANEIYNTLKKRFNSHQILIINEYDDSIRKEGYDYYLVSSTSASKEKVLNIYNQLSVD